MEPTVSSHVGLTRPIELPKRMGTALSRPARARERSKTRTKLPTKLPEVPQGDAGMAPPLALRAGEDVAGSSGKVESVNGGAGDSGGVIEKKSTSAPLASDGEAEPTDSSEDSSEEEEVPEPKPEPKFSHFNNKLTIQDFDLLKVLGKGSFGKVMLVKRCDEKCDEGEKDTLYALKTLRKSTLITRNQLAHTATERQILQDIYSPFLVHLVYAFQTTDKLYMVLDYMGGGELFFWLKKEKRFSENRCRLYAAEIALALDAMHKENIVYRDLKPENVLLDGSGHVKLTDFGLAKGNVYSYDGTRGTKTFCGTPEYLAPEIIENKGHGLSVDWWALGTILYEMLLGLPPFYDTNIHKMYTKILYDPLRFPKAENRQISEKAKVVLRRFLERKIDSRLGSGGINEEMQSLEFFSDQDFEAVYNHEVVPSFRPPVSEDETDVSNFDVEFTREPPQDSLVTNRLTRSAEEKSRFHGFTYMGGLKPMESGMGGGTGRASEGVVKKGAKVKCEREASREPVQAPSGESEEKVETQQ